MISSEYKKPRKTDFPQCAKDALIRIGKLDEAIERRVSMQTIILRVESLKMCVIHYRKSMYEQKESRSLLRADC